MSRTLFLGITSRRVDTRTLAESVAVANSSIPALQFDRAIFAVLGITIANGSNKVAAESRDVRAELNTPALESSGIFSRNFTNSIDNFKGVGDAGLVIKVSGLGEDLGRAEVIVAAEDHAVAIIQVGIGRVAVHRVVSCEDDSRLTSLVTKTSGRIAVSKARILTGSCIRLGISLEGVHHSRLQTGKHRGLIGERIVVTAIGGTGRTSLRANEAKGIREGGYITEIANRAGVGHNGGDTASVQGAVGTGNVHLGFTAEQTAALTGGAVIRVETGFEHKANLGVTNIFRTGQPPAVTRGEA